MGILIAFPGATRSANRRALLFKTTSGLVVEQDPEYRVRVAGNLLDEGAVVGFGSAQHQIEGELHLGDHAALLFARRDAHAFHFSVRVVGPVAKITQLPRALAEAPILEGWILAARFLLNPPSRVPHDVQLPS